jgi:hypothetical protein
MLLRPVATIFRLKFSAVIGEPIAVIYKCILVKTWNFTLQEK